MKRIPKSFPLMGHTITVQILGKRDWPHPNAVGWCDPNSNLILLLRQPQRSQMLHAFYHETTHMVLAAMGSKLYSNESFVDAFGGLLAQIMEGAE